MADKQTKKTTKTKKANKKPNYIYTIGRRKEAVARVRLYLRKKGKMMVNNMPIDEYFKNKYYEPLYQEPLRTCNALDKYLITVKVQGSGIMGQLGAINHGVSRALVKLDEEKFRPILKKRGFLTRDPRMKERRKVGTGGKARRQKQSPKR
jgi:small subunit ribosomal protein S9